MSAQESRHEKFKRIGEKRTKRILKEIEILANLSNTHNYEFNEEEVNKIFEVLDTQLKEARNKFIIKRSKDFKL